MPKFNIARPIFILALALNLAACNTLAPPANTQQLYAQAIGDAAVASPEKILPLLPLPASDNVIVVSWVTEARLPCSTSQPHCSYSTGADRMWVTLEGEVKQKCQRWQLSGDALRRRLEQLLGLPMDSPLPYRKVKFISIQVPRARLQRACLGVNEQNLLQPSCTLDAQPSTADDLKNYVQQQMAGSYIVGNPKGPGYPFTRLGYTYDWHPKATASHHYGASEFLIMPNTPVAVIADATTDDYCKLP